MRYPQGHLTLAVMGDLLRHPGTDQREMKERLDVEDPATIRVTLGRLLRQGRVRELAHGGYMLTRSGLDLLAEVRRLVSV